VLNGHLLQETASVAKAIWSVARPGRSGLPVFHLVSPQVELFLEDERRRTALLSKLRQGESESSLREAIEWPSFPRLPAGPSLIGNFPLATPAVARFQMRTLALGLVVRLRERYGNSVVDLPYNILEELLEMRTRVQE